MPQSALVGSAARSESALALSPQLFVDYGYIDTDPTTTGSSGVSSLAATQRLTVVTFAGQAALAVASQFQRWRAAPDRAAVDRLCAAVRANSLSFAVVYFAEWVDRWLMGDSRLPAPIRPDTRPLV